MIAVPKVKYGQIQHSKNQVTETVSGNKVFHFKHYNNIRRNKGIRDVLSSEGSSNVLIF